jgi:hypothetical protein
VVVAELFEPFGQLELAILDLTGFQASAEGIA